MKPAALLASALACMQLFACGSADAAKCKPKRSDCVDKKTQRPTPYQPPQRIEHLPAPAAPIYRVPVAPSMPQPSVTPAPPALITTCDPGGCWNGSGGRYNGGAAGSYLDGSGRLCQQVGTSMQCF